MDHQVYDIAIIGGGINGSGIARDAAGRGLKVLLCERDDLAGGTSSVTTKLIHGGLRYLEHGEFRLVKEALHERDVLLQSAPHIVWPLRFILPFVENMRPYWVIRLGLWLYDKLAKSKLLPTSHSISFAEDVSGQALKGGYNKGFTFADCWVQDARLVVLNARDAANHGAKIMPRTEFIGAKRKGSFWEIELNKKQSGETFYVKAKALVNAAGPWSMDVYGYTMGEASERRLQLVKGSHIVIPKLFDHDNAYILQQPDKRFIFAIPFEKEYTLIGTTEVAYDPEGLSHLTISKEETQYLCDTVNLYFNKKVSPDQVVWSYSGVRPLIEDKAKTLSAISREYTLEIEASPDKAPLISVFGGKLTTHRVVAERAMELLRAYLPVNDPWTEYAALPGGDIPVDFNSWLITLQQRYPWMPQALLWRYARNYGTLIEKIIGDATSLQELGEDFGGGLYEAELEYLYEQEWAYTPEDILWRRTKLGLTAPKGTETKILVWLSTRKKKG